jgi:hypothetical protein
MVGSSRKKARGKHRLDKFYHLAKEQGYDLARLNISLLPLAVYSVSADELVPLVGEASANPILCSRGFVTVKTAVKRRSWLLPLQSSFRHVLRQRQFLHPLAFARTHFRSGRFHSRVSVPFVFGGIHKRACYTHELPASPNTL